MSLDENSNYEIVRSLYLINKLFLFKNKVNVIIRPHPMYDKKKQVQKLKKIINFPTNWFISQNKEINEDIYKSKCAILLSTASAFNCVKHGLPVLNLRSNFNVLSNYMDFLPKNNFLSKTYKINEIVKILNIIFISKKRFKIKDIDSAKKKLNLDSFDFSNKKIQSFLI